MSVRTFMIQFFTVPVPLRQKFPVPTVPLPVTQANKRSVISRGDSSESLTISPLSWLGPGVIGGTSS